MAKILVIDDALIMHDLIKRIFKKTDHEVIGIASNGRDGLEKYKELKPDIIIMDIVMPEANGIASIDLIKDYDKDAKIIICSAYSTLKFVSDRIKSDKISCIRKPFDNEQLIKAVNETITGKIVNY